MHKICQHCGKEFFTYQKNRIYCSYSCSRNALYKKEYKYKISDKEYSSLFKKYREDIRKILFKRLTNIQYYDEAWQDELITLWLCALRILEKGNSIENVPRSYIINSLIKTAIKRNGRDIANVKRISKCINYQPLSLNTILYFSENGDNNFLIEDTLKDKSIDISKTIDLKNLVTKICCEAALDKDVEYAIIQAEERNQNFKINSYENILKNYGIEIPYKYFSERALTGAKKMYSKYKNEINEVAEISENELKFKPKKSEYLEPRICCVCGRIFLPLTPWQMTCSRTCHDMKNNEKRNIITKENLKKQLIEDIEKLRKEKQLLKITVNNQKQTVKRISAKLGTLQK